MGGGVEGNATCDGTRGSVLGATSQPWVPCTPPRCREPESSPARPPHHSRTTDKRRLRSALPLSVGRSKDSVPREHHPRAPGLTSLGEEGAGDGRTVENYPQQHTPWWKQDAGVSHIQGRAASPPCGPSGGGIKQGTGTDRSAERGGMPPCGSGIPMTTNPRDDVVGWRSVPGFAASRSLSWD